MNNYPEDVDMSRVLDYPDYKQSEAAMEAYDDVEALVTTMRGTSAYEDALEWASSQKDSIDTADFWDRKITIEPLILEEFIDCSVTPVKRDDCYEYYA